jgi:hypothetical protein
MSAVHLVLGRPRISMQLPRMEQNTESNIVQPGNSDLRQRMHALERAGCYLAVLLSALNSLVTGQHSANANNAILPTFAYRSAMSIFC